jgi:hypothetical protein
VVCTRRWHRCYLSKTSMRLWHGTGRCSGQNCTPVCPKLPPLSRSLFSWAMSRSCLDRSERPRSSILIRSPFQKRLLTSLPTSTSKTSTACMSRSKTGSQSSWGQPTSRTGSANSPYKTLLVLFGYLHRFIKEQTHKRPNLPVQSPRARASFLWAQMISSYNNRCAKRSSRLAINQRWKLRPKSVSMNWI